MYRYAVVNAKAKQTKKRKILNKIIIAVVLLLVIAVSLAIWIYWKSMTPTILDVAETRIKSETARVVNEAVCLALSEHTDYSELVNIEKNTDNEIIMISANKVSLVNTLARNTAMLSQKKSTNWRLSTSIYLWGRYREFRCLPKKVPKSI